MTSNKPYLIRAFYDWISDNGFTPHIVVNAGMPGVRIPKQYIAEQGKVVLNISATAADRLQLGNEFIEFGARFSGVLHHISLPVESIQAIYARESGQGMMFKEEEEPEGAAPHLVSTTATSSSSKPSAKGKPNLKVVK